VVTRLAYLRMGITGGPVGACMRMIEAAGGDPPDRAGPGGPGDISWCTRPHEEPSATLPFRNARSCLRCRCGQVQYRTRRSLLLLLAVVSEARRRGDDYALLGPVNPTASCSTPTAAERSGHSMCPKLTSAGPG